jgi:hypothetical protein
VPEDDVLEEALALAGKLAVHPLEALVASKRLIAATFTDAVAAGRQRENAAFDELLETPENRAAVAAFLSGRSRATTTAEGRDG